MTDKKPDIKKLIDFSNGKYSYNDYLQVKRWFFELDENQSVKECLAEQWKTLLDTESQGDNSLQHIFEKIRQAILLEEKKPAPANMIWSFYRQAAAVLFIPVLAFSLWYYISSKSSRVVSPVQPVTQSWVEIQAPEGARVEFLLPDSTTGWLNSGSKLKYPPVFSRQRQVRLSGEAWFEVKHAGHSEFVVSVPDLDVKVLGTKFNVSAYPGDPFTNVVLKEGKVEIDGKAGVFNQVLSPDEKITFDRGLKSLRVNGVDADRFSAWKDGYLVIDNESLGQVVGRIERWYNAEIVIRDEALKNYRFKATFKDEPLEEVLRLIAITTPIDYKIEKRVADSNGLWKQKKVIIKLK